MKATRALFLLALFFLNAHLTVQGQTTLTTLHSFTALDSETNSDGVAPLAGLVLSGNMLYGTTAVGGARTNGTLFAVSLNGMVFTNLHSFTGGNDGSRPSAGLIISGTNVYGAAEAGGSNSSGTIFSLNTDGTCFVPIYSFTATIFNENNFTSTNGDGAGPLGTLVLSHGTLYGTASGGGVFGQGTVFALSTNGMNFTNLHNFPSLSGTKATNSQGANPNGGLLLANGVLYGMTYHGGSTGQGTIFRLNPDGSDFTNLHDFTGFPSDGANPSAALVISGNTLYGTTSFGGNANEGTVFGININGGNITNLHQFTTFVHGTNSDGYTPEGTLLLSGGLLYGTATGGGSTGDGTIFAVNADDTGFTNLYNFTAPDPVNFITNSDGIAPYDGLILSSDTLYGTAQSGGAFGNGTVFALSLSGAPPALQITPAGVQVILSWPAAASNFGLQTAPDLVSRSWSNITAGIGTAGTNFVFTNSVSGPAAFFRLQHN